jgi:hypothetical protein
MAASAPASGQRQQPAAAGSGQGCEAGGGGGGETPCVAGGRCEQCSDSTIKNCWHALSQRWPRAAGVGGGCRACRACLGCVRAEFGRECDRVATACVPLRIRRAPVGSPHPICRTTACHPGGGPEKVRHLHHDRSLAVQLGRPQPFLLTTGATLASWWEAPATTSSSPARSQFEDAWSIAGRIGQRAMASPHMYSYATSNTTRIPGRWLTCADRHSMAWSACPSCRRHLPTVARHWICSLMRTDRARSSRWRVPTVLSHCGRRGGSRRGFGGARLGGGAEGEPPPPAPGIGTEGGARVGRGAGLEGGALEGALGAGREGGREDGTIGGRRLGTRRCGTAGAARRCRSPADAAHALIAPRQTEASPRERSATRDPPPPARAE